MLEHTSAFSGPQSFTVTLPSNVSCPGGAGDGSICTLQVIEYMSNHGAPCFYHHCADITIGASGGGDAGSVPPHDEACGCAVRGSPASAAGALLIAALVLARRRRGRR
jgi:MYXO-CTERM domain-containing protein